MFLWLSILFTGLLIGFFSGGMIITSVFKRQIRYGEVEISGELYSTRKVSK